MNLGQLKTSVGRKFSLDTTAGTDDSNAMIDWANEGVVDILLRTKCYIASGDMTLSSVANDYRLDVEIIEFIDAHVTSGNGATPFVRVSVGELMDKRRQSTNVGTTLYYAVSGDLLMVYPTPSSSTNVRFYLVPRPTSMSSDANDPNSAAYGGIPKEYHKAIETYMMWQAAEAQGDFSVSLEQEYERRIGRIKQAITFKGGKLPRAKLAPLRRTVSSDPAIYP
jgi:hypothetical protein